MYISIVTLLLITGIYTVLVSNTVVFIQLSLGWDMYISIVALLLITGIYTVLGK